MFYTENGQVTFNNLVEESTIRIYERKESLFSIPNVFKYGVEHLDLVWEKQQTLENIQFEIDEDLPLDEIGESIVKQLDDFAQGDDEKWADASKKALEQLEEKLGEEATFIIALGILILSMF